MGDSKAFLWSSWQRASMLYYWQLLGNQLRLGYDFRSNRDLAIKGLASIPELFALYNLQQLEFGKKTPYMCRWAYELLRNDRACVAMDLTRLHECYNAFFGDRPARCMDGKNQCDGRSSEACRRFTGTMTTDQSAHDLRCQKPCKRLYWDRQSFLSVVGPKAVCVNSTDDVHLRYCRASNQTIAITHVWSHGQGGRPDFGFNVCLHRRYADLARSLDCGSYWMDTPCIPEEEPLRTECIKNINWIFNNSKVTLVCDKDLMTIDIAALTMELRESILSILSVSDWNVRAWTLLEAMRGRNNIHLLYKDNQVVCFEELLRSVHQEGRIDIVILFLTSQHLIPHLKPDDYEIFPGHGGLASDEDRRTQMGFISIGEGSILLSHRHASRKGDDILIWSLLVNEKAMKNVDQLWKSQLGIEIPTGFLISSTPRIQGSRGLGWAPCSPTVQPSSSLSSNLTSESVYLSYDGGDTGRGLMTVEGLQAKWLVHKFPTLTEDEPVIDPKTNSTSIIARINELTAKHLKTYTWGALLQPCANRGPRSTPAQYRGNARGPLLAVYGSSDKRCWEWKGIYKWNTDDVALPEFKVEELLLV